MDRFSHDELRSLIEESRGQCVSLYLPTHRVKEEAQQDPIRLKNMLREVERRLSGSMESTVLDEMLRPAFALLDDRRFWQVQEGGLALFLRPGFMRYFRLPVRFEERIVVATHFQLQPLFPLLTGDGEFYLLALSHKAPRLFRGSRFEFEEVPLKNAPASLAEATRFTQRQKQLQMHSVPGGRGMYHGHGDPGDLRRDDLVEYFRQLNRSIRETLPFDRTPLVLAGVDSHFPIYREVNTHPRLVAEGVAGNPDDAQPEDLHHQAWEAVAPLFRQEQESALAAFERLAGTDRVASALATILPAACHGRVESLFLAAGRSVWGQFDPESGEVRLTEEEEPGSEDLLNLAAIHTYLQKGAVFAVPPDRVPGQADLAAVMRY
ncbi:MAG: hypothetical protein ACOY93_10020 [Bacillota bacterium]